MGGELYACKYKSVMDNKKLSAKAEKSLLSEFLIGSEINHPNIMKYLYLQILNDNTKLIDEYSMLLEFIKGEDLNNYLS